MYSLYFIVTVVLLVLGLTVLFGYVANRYLDKRDQVKRDEEENHGPNARERLKVQLVEALAFI